MTAWQHVTSLIPLAIPAMAPQRTSRFRPLLGTAVSARPRPSTRRGRSHGYSTETRAERCCSFLPLRGEKKRQVVGCWLECLWPLACPPSWLVTLRGDIRFKNVGLSRTGIHEKPSNRAPISRFSSQLIGNLYYLGLVRRVASKGWHNFVFRVGQERRC